MGWSGLKNPGRAGLYILLCSSIIGMLLLSPHVSAADDSPHVIVSEISPTPEVFAGDTFNETIELTNVGDKKALRVRLVVDIDYPFALMNTSSNIFVGSIRGDRSSTVAMQISVDKKALVAIYSIDFQIEWEDSNGATYRQFNTFNVRVLGRPNIDIQETISDRDPSRVSAGESFIKYLNLENMGVEEARMVKLSLDISYPFTLPRASSNIFIGDLGIDEKKSVSVEISVDRNAVGVYSIHYTISYEDSYGWNYEKTGAFGVEVLGKPKMLIYETISSRDGNRIFTGDTFTKEFNLTNIGGYETKRAQLSLDIEYPFTLSDSSSNLLFGDLGVGESRAIPVEFSVDRNAPVAVYSIPYTITYENIYGESYEKTGLFGVEVNGKPQVLVDEITVDPSPLSLGQSGLMIVKLTNIGSDIAHDASIRVFGAKGILASSFAYVAKINNKQSESIMFPVSLDSGLRPGTYLLNITVANRDYLNNTYHLSNLYELKLSAEPAFVPPFYIGLTVGLASLGLLGYVIYNWNPEEAEKADSGMESQQRGNRRQYVMLILGVILMYVLIFPIPYVVHSNLENAGIVVYNDEIPLEALPQNLQEVCRLRGINAPVMLLVKHVEPEWTTMVISTENLPMGTTVEMSEHIINWHVDWRDFNLANQPFQKLAISKVERLNEFEAFFERVLYAQRGSIGLYDLSKVTFYGGPILFILCLTLVVQKRLALWNLPAVFSCYSFQIWSMNTLASVHRLTVTTEWEYFGYLFVGLIPLTLYAWYFERSTGGRPTARKMMALSHVLGLFRE